MIKSEVKTRRGSALIVVLLVMGVLLILTVGLSNLIIREIRQTGSVVNEAQAYYAAEAGIENALFDLQNSLPGYEDHYRNGVSYDNWTLGAFSEASVQDGSEDFRYQIRNRGDKYPYFDDDKPVLISADMAVPKEALYSSDAPLSYREKTYNVLPLNGTVTVPLFADCGEGSVNDVKDFLLEYYVNFELDPDIASNLGPAYAQMIGKLENFDILRWKVYGEPLDKAGKTDAISDFYPASSVDNPGSPVCIGTNQDIDRSVSCLLPVANFVKTKEDENQLITPEDVDSSSNVNGWSTARECYQTDAGVMVASVGIQQGCSIKTFIDSHTKNYLTLTNVVNPQILGISNPSLAASKANIYYRVVARGGRGCTAGSAGSIFKVSDALKGEFKVANLGLAQLGTSTSDSTADFSLPREYAEISADGYSANHQVKQSIDVSLKLNSFLPVFNFSLYRTDTSDSRFSPVVKPVKTSVFELVK